MSSKQHILQLIQRFLFNHYLIGLILFSLSFIIRISFLSYETQEDALITFRYVENLINGYGFVYNIGEHVLGTSTPLYTIFIAFLGVLGLPFVEAGRILNILADSLVTLLLYRILSEKGYSLTGLLVGLLYTLSAHNIFWSASGMETGLYVFFIILSFYLYLKHFSKWASFTATLCVLTRIDGVILLVILGIDKLFRHRKFPWKEAFISCITFAPWGIFSILYFGSPIPNSATVKISFYKNFFYYAPTKSIINYLLTLSSSMANKTHVVKILFIFVVLGVIFIIVHSREMWIIPGYVLAYLGAMIAGDALLFPWYFSSLNAPYFLLIGLGIFFSWQILNQLNQQWYYFKKISHVFIFAISLIILGSFIHAVFQAHEKGQRYTLRTRQSLKAVGIWLNENTDENTIICAGDIGSIGFYSKRPILDYVGLVSPQVIPYNNRLDRTGIIQDFQPTYFIIGEYDPLLRELYMTNWFTDTYTLKARYLPKAGNVTLWQRGKIETETK